MVWFVFRFGKISIRLYILIYQCCLLFVVNTRTLRLISAKIMQQHYQYLIIGMSKRIRYAIEINRSKIT